MSIFEEYFRQRSDLTEASKTPRVVLFSHAGFSEAMRVDINGTHFVRASPHSESRHYCGLPYLIDERATAAIVVTHETLEEVLRRLGSPRQRQSAVTVKIDGIMGGAPVVEIVAANLTAAQLCDIIRAWLDADCQKWGLFERALDRVIVEHGRFE